MDASLANRSANAWLEDLRKQLLRLAARRVDPEHVEDVVQDALRVVIEKAPTAQPELAWCFQVLRHTIGNHYRREQTRRRWVEQDPEGEKLAQAAAPSLLEAMDAQETARLFEEAIVELGGPEDNCRRYLGRLLEGASPQQVARAGGLDAAVFYRRLYRCRQRLREILRRKGIHA
jgi:RNA polymerase sigma factor (sigma-70 family)